MIIKWARIENIEKIPPLGDELKAHISNYSGRIKNASCSAWRLLYRTLRKNKLPITDVAFSDTGKPYFPDSNVYFSLSHTKGICVIAIDNKPVGVDVECVDRRVKPSVVNKALSETEKKQFDGDFIRLWCRKEAIAKMNGSGIVGYPLNIETTACSFEEQTVEVDMQKYWIVATSTPLC